MGTWSIVGIIVAVCVVLRNSYPKVSKEYNCKAY